MTNISYSKTAQRHGFHLVDPSPWPIVAAFAALSFTLSWVQWMHGYSGGGWVTILSFISLLLSAGVWWRDITREGTYQGHHTSIVQVGLRYGML